MDRKNLVGQVFGRLTVLAPAPPSPCGAPRWMVQCKPPCGTVKTIQASNLLAGLTVSCGCWSQERKTKHGMSRSHYHLYQVWVMMRQRCTNPRHKVFHLYGGRGITVCERWQDFQNFVADVGPRPGPGYSIERINNDLGYTPENVIWATATQQSLNTRQNHRIAIGEENLTITEWARKFKIATSTIYARLDQGWDPIRAIMTPSYHSLSSKNKK